MCGKQITFSNKTTKTLPHDLQTAFAQFCTDEPQFLADLKEIYAGRTYENEMGNLFLDRYDQVHPRIYFSMFDIPLYTKILSTNYFKIHWIANEASIEFLCNLAILLHNKVSNEYWNGLEMSSTPILIDYINQQMTKDELINEAGRNVENISKYLFTNNHLSRKQHNEVKTKILICKYSTDYHEISILSENVREPDGIRYGHSRKPKLIDMMFSLEGKSFKSLELDLTHPLSQNVMRAFKTNTKMLLNAAEVSVNIKWTMQSRASGVLQCKITSDTVNFEQYRYQNSLESQHLMMQLEGAVREAINLYIKQNKKIKSKKNISVSVTGFDVKCLVITFALREGNKSWNITNDSHLQDILQENIKRVFNELVFVELFMPRCITNSKKYLEVSLNAVLPSEDSDFTAFVNEFETIRLPDNNACEYFLFL